VVTRPGRLATALTEEEQTNVRRALRHLQLVFGSLKDLAKAMDIPYQSLRQVVGPRRSLSLNVASGLRSQQVFQSKES